MSDVNPFMTTVAAIVMLAPLAFALVIDYQVRTFQREAFGHLAKAARYLRWLAWAIFVYYVAVLVGSAIIGDMAGMYRWPVTAEGLQIYVRIGAAIVGYVFAFLVAKELYMIAAPARGAGNDT